MTAARVPSGAKHSIKLSTFLTSTGIPSLDSFIGGLAVGSIVILKEDQHHTYAKQIVNLFIAEGLVSGHSLLYAAREHLDYVLAKLPAIKHSSNPVEPLPDDLRIAWRYNVLTDVENVKSAKLIFGHYFDLSRALDAYAFIQEKQSSTVYFQPKLGETLDENLSNLLFKINEFISSGRASSIQRIVINCLCSPSWGVCKDSMNFDRTVLKFFSMLHLLVQGSLCVVCITVRGIATDLLNRLRHHADYIFNIDGFDGLTSLNPLYEEYNGLLDAVQLPWMGGSLEPVSRPVTLQWAFKVKRHQFMVQHLHLPPCLSDSVSRSNVADPVISSSLSSASIREFSPASSHPIDF